MFPLDFPLRVLAGRAHYGDRVLDPFCGRGTTNFAARILGLDSVGVDSSPVAAAITAAKLVNTTPTDIIAEARRILANGRRLGSPAGEFWDWAYNEKVLFALCRLRASFLDECSTPARIALRGIILGALHGPRQKTFQSYLSNQSPRTYAPKPAYAVRFWKARRMRPQPVDVFEIIARRANRYYSSPMSGTGQARLADSRSIESLKPRAPNKKFTWVVTSPPYYGMRTYIPDQWLRHWFVGGADQVDYSNRDQVVHSSPDDFASDLRKVWQNSALFCSRKARLVVRFGGISDRDASPREVIRRSFQHSGWQILTIKSAGDASHGKRQADTFLRERSKPVDECVIWARPTVC